MRRMKKAQKNSKITLEAWLKMGLQFVGPDGVAAIVQHIRKKLLDERSAAVRAIEQIETRLQVVGEGEEAPRIVRAIRPCARDVVRGVLASFPRGLSMPDLMRAIRSVHSDVSENSVRVALSTNTRGRAPMFLRHGSQKKSVFLLNRSIPASHERKKK